MHAFSDDAMVKHIPPPLDPPPPSDAVCLEVAALRAMLGLPPEEPEPNERAPPEPALPSTDAPYGNNRGGPPFTLTS